MALENPRAGSIGAILGVVFAAATSGLGCGLLPDAPPSDQVLDGPIDGLTAAQRLQFARGDEEFARRFSPEEGLGPLFVAASCASCHPGDGDGHPVFDITRFGRAAPGGFDPMLEHGGPQLQHRAVPGYEAETLPEGVTGLSRLTPPSVTGLGLLEAVDDVTLLALADPADLDGDGISGRLQRIGPNGVTRALAGPEARSGEGAGTRPENGALIGRFGKKAGAVNLLHQAAGAYLQDMGLTTDLFPADEVNPRVGRSATDPAADPEIRSSALEAVVFYLRTLRPPPRRDDDLPDVVAGERLFEETGCASCHRPTLRTGRSGLEALDGVEFHPYTDLLLHDMGPELDDGYTEGIAATSEWRTAPLWGAGLARRFQGGRAYYLHDGRAGSFAEAIGYHGGEAARSRASFDALSPADRARILAFLESL